MCGILGLHNYGNISVPINESLIARLRDTMTHRGPDAEGQWINGRRDVGLGFRRLSIIDLSANGDQPMTNEEGTIRLVFNGEIYNFRELRQELEAKGHIFRSLSDTEV